MTATLSNLPSTDPVSGPCSEIGLASFTRCVDWLRQMHDSTADPALRRLVNEVLADLMELGPVDGELGEVVLGALASVLSAFELAEAAV